MRLLWLGQAALFTLLSTTTTITTVRADSAGALYPPGLLPLINHANSLLSAGQFNDAAKAYTEAIDQSPADYVLYYKRGTAYFSLSRHPSAISDFDKVIKLTSNSFDKAHLMKARMYAKDGHWTEAKDSLKMYTDKVGRGDNAATELLESVKDAEAAMKKTAQAQRAKLWTACEEASSSALTVASHSIEIRQMRAECSLAAGDLEMAIGDLTRLIHLTAPSTSAFMRIFRLTYFLLPESSTDGALSQLKQCLYYDPDSKECFAARRLAKSFEKSFEKLGKLHSDENWKAVLNLLEHDALASKFDEALEQNTNEDTLGFPTWLKLQPPKYTSPRRETILRNLCKAHVRLGQPKKAEQWCRELEHFPNGGNDVDAMLGRGEALLVDEEYEEAMRVMEKAWEACGRGDSYVKSRVVRAQKLLKQSKQKDYYKVLDVARDADAKAIKKAYRKAVMKAHPDKGGTEAKMAAVNEAYEVLSDPELRQRFDNGDDPNDPMSQQGGGGGAYPFPGGGAGPFGQFFGGGSGFQFHFSQGGRHH